MGMDFKFTPGSGSQEILITSLINAPPEKVFAAFLDPALIEAWWGPRLMTTRVGTLDPRPGGSWRFVQTHQNGQVYAFHGVFHQIIPSKLIIQTFEYDGEPDHVILETIRFEDHIGQTRVIDQSVFQSIADRDAMLSEDMEAGAYESMEKLALLFV